MKKVMKKVMYVGQQLGKIIEIKEIMSKFYLEIKNTVSWNSTNVFATYLMRILENFLRKAIAQNVSLIGQKVEEVYDIVDVGTNHRFQVLGDNYHTLHNCLGVQFGMGYKSLAIKLSVDTGRTVKEAESQKLLGLHQKTYRKYWKYIEDVLKFHQKNGYYPLWDGFSLLKDIDNSLSIKNFPVQGTGAVIMRRAAYLAHKRGLRLIATLHDALYINYDKVTEADHPDILSECMHQAVTDILGDVLEIRQDRDIHEHNDVWVEGGGKKFYNLLSKYLEPMKTEEDLEKHLLNTIFS